ncbi:PTS sugar transporter subunit IIA [Fervidibacillus halotolerans]|uniref:Ascorbate-specific PTS system EIIA component n=1 Tax=Fervidibacillus halotolerans TaxID=2980027 RepID=A0A9E8M2F1_9BACI|nr:PTS sugar transporter subunit IIA [Fervidibacillus halotolerans]WAA13149.1 PTS sugar transporter subunit IIA [Fervidibacillus halotolerans]
MLTKFLPKDHLQHEERVKNWEEAIKIASRPLLKKGVIEKKYIDNMIKNVYTNGPYIVLNDYFALPHAQPGIGVNKSGMALLTLTEPVDLLGHPVKVFLVLAAYDSSSHLQALSEITKLMMEQENFDVILNGNTDEIYQLLLKGGIS